MKLSILTFCALFELSITIPVENRSTKVLELSHPNKIFIRSLHGDESIKSIDNDEFNSISDNEQEYIFFSDLSGKVIIIDVTTYEKVISYNLPEISKSISAIVNDTFYNIDTLNGTIFSTNVGNLLRGPDNINWALVGSFPKETKYHIRCSSAVNDSIIYFVTFGGVLYSYDSLSKITLKVGDIQQNDEYASLVIVREILYILKYLYLYSFDGTSIRSILSKPGRRESAGLFQQGNDVCLVGGNYKVEYPDPVYCYNTSSYQWSTPSYINYGRWYPGVVTISLRTYIFGGWAYKSTYLWFDSVEVLDHETNRWGFIPSPLTEGQKFIQALVFKI